MRICGLQFLVCGGPSSNLTMMMVMIMMVMVMVMVMVMIVDSDGDHSGGDQVELQ